MKTDDIPAGKYKPERESTTLALSAYATLRDEIIDGSLLPDKKLRIRELCERYSMGLSPIREALSRLASEGLVVQSAQRGFAVASFSLQDLAELVRTKKWLNERGVRESIIHGDDAWEERVILAYHRLAKTPRTTPGGAAGEITRNPEWNKAHLTFHASLLDACRSHWLKSFCSTLFFASERYRAVARLKGDPQARLNEHRLIMEAVVARDADRAVELLNQHFDTTVALVRESLVEQGLAGN